jgi:hypothetical protein
MIVRSLEPPWSKAKIFAPPCSNQIEFGPGLSFIGTPLQLSAPALSHGVGYGNAGREIGVKISISGNPAATDAIGVFHSDGICVKAVAIDLARHKIVFLGHIDACSLERDKTDGRKICFRTVRFKIILLRIVVISEDGGVVHMIIIGIVVRIPASACSKGENPTDQNAEKRPPK